MLRPHLPRLAQQLSQQPHENYLNTPQLAKHSLIPVALQTMGPINAEGLRFLYELSDRLVSVSGDPRESSFLFQRLSVLVQRFNVVALRGTFSSETDVGE